MTLSHFSFRTFPLLAVASLMVLATSTPASAQEMDGRWLPFVGCWAPTGQGATDGVLCVEPTDDGVELYTVSGGEVVTSDLLVADGTSHPRSIEGCEGHEIRVHMWGGDRSHCHRDHVFSGADPVD